MRRLRASLKSCAPAESLLIPSASRSYSRAAAAAAGTPRRRKMGDNTSGHDYTKWTKDGLIERLRRVEAELQKHLPISEQQQPKEVVASAPAAAAAPAPAPAPKKRKETAKLDPANYNTRYIVLKLAYLGKNYGGFEYSASGILPSVEEELFKALTRACLIFPEDQNAVDFSTCEYSKCGRTDRGVSAFGQVIGIRVRSAKPVPGRMKRKKKERKEDEGEVAAAAAAAAVGPQPKTTEEEAKAREPPPFDPIADELEYPKILNRLLPRDIRVLAWCPTPPADFSARFSCREREYRYFFTQPAFNPPIGPAAADQPHTGWLDIDAMRDAASRFEGDQDFQNFCKIDPAKNITTYRRGILESNIYEAEGMGTTMPHLLPDTAVAPPDGSPYPKVYYFRVRGTAFLWHQIRHMVSVLFHVGQGLEKPDIVTRLLDTKANPRRPTYTMADEVPLVLWDCVFRDDQGRDLDWIYVDGRNTSAFDTTESLWRLWREVKMDEILASGLLRLVAQGVSAARKETSDVQQQQQHQQGETRGKKKRAGLGGEYSIKRFEGGNGARAVGKYLPIMVMKLMDSPQEQNDRYAQRKGFSSHAELMKERMAKFEKMEEGG
ncbi:tRNA pseudouridine38/39 synthase [Geosmithia morbida]|uniref:tRNA pseudouridine38/39 synthase n=1 Tax=Geosmithia morbida TaxID=1094350 RepID=A0A9P4Z3A1_9HYPO|nr:tRNA pseudouridine38/39 synthase [Geosmithia morbida]KAF4125849.1 tRNA pseudouridine38/39 synthase [Geosmithia morbida]